MKAENFSHPKTADHPAIVRAAESMGRVEQQGQVPTARDLFESFNRARTSPEVGRYNPGRSRRNVSFD